MNDETLTWHEADGPRPPLRTLLFLRLRHLLDGRINFCTGLWDKKDECFLYWRSFDPEICGRVPAPWHVTHWVMSEAANKVWFQYAWTPEIEPLEPAPGDRIL